MPKATKAGSSNQWEEPAIEEQPEPVEETPGDVLAAASDDVILSDAVHVDTGLTRPVVNAPKADWVDYAVVRGMTREDAEAATKADLIEKLKDAEAS